jgi:Xaa-Pro aminopeptidase
LRRELTRRRLSAVVLTDPADQFYLTGFDGEDGAALLTHRKVYLVTDSRFDLQADIQAPWARKVIRTGPLDQAVAGLCRRSRLKRIGFHPARLTVEQFSQLRRRLATAKLVPLADPLDQLRVCKDDVEIKAIRKAVTAAERAFRRVRRWIRPGLTERQVAARLDYEMRLQGAEEPSFPTIVASGGNAALPHAKPGDRVIATGSPLLIDWGARVGMYCSDLTRVLFIGRIPPRLGKVYQVVLDAQVKAIQAIRDNVRASQVDSIARQLITVAGFGQQFGHGLGHGLGLQVHENPRVSRLSKATLLAGMVFTVEPGVYLPGTGGVRIEDDVLVTSDGVEVLSTLPKNLRDMVV